MGVGHPQRIDKVIRLEAGCQLAATTAFLRLENVQRLALDVTLVRQRHHDILRGDQIFEIQADEVFENLGPADIAIGFPNGDQLFTDDLQQTGDTAENFEIFSNLLENFAVLANQLLLLQAGESVQAQIQNRLRLGFGQHIAVVRQA